MKFSRSAISGAILFWTLIPASSEAGLVPQGDPVNVGSWSQTFSEYIGGVSFDSMRVEWLHTGNDLGFEAPVFDNFTVQGWQSTIDATFPGDEPLLERILLASATGTPTTEIVFDLKFEGDMQDPVSFMFSAYSGDQMLEEMRADWNGTSWEIITGEYNCVVPIPEACTFALLGISMCLGLRFRRRNNGRDLRPQ